MRRAALVLAALLIAPLAGPAPAQPSTRDAAYAALKSDDAVERGRGIVLLARDGGMADVPALIALLRDPHPELRGLAEQAIWVVWSRSGDEAIDRLFEQGIDEINSGKVKEAIATFSRIIEQKPGFAEGWNKRATIYYLAGDLQRSLADCAEVLKRNPQHFGALAGCGQVHLQLGEYEKAREHFRRALAVNPNLEGASFSLRMLDRLLEDQRRKGS